MKPGTRDRVMWVVWPAAVLVFLCGLFVPSALIKVPAFVALSLLVLILYLVSASGKPGSAGALNTIPAALYAPVQALWPQGDFRPVAEHVGFWLAVALLATAGTLMLGWPDRYPGWTKALLDTGC
jgi:hypothetical protein